MSAKSNHIRIGIFVIVAVVLFVLGLLAFGAASYFQKKTNFETLVEGEVGGLSVGSPVQLRGVPIGKVSRIDFVWNVYPASESHGIVVEFQINGDIVPRIPGMTEPQVITLAAEKGLRAVVKGQGITGTSLLSLENLDPTNYPTQQLDYKPKAIFVPSAPGQFTRMLDAVGKSLESIQKVNFDAIGDGITNTLQAVTSLANRLGQIDTAAISTNANDMIIQIKNLSARLQDIVEEMKLGAVSQNANEFLTGLRETNAKLQQVLDRVNAVPLQQTVGDLHDAVRNLNDVLLKLDQYPSGFFLGDPPAPAKSTRPPSK